MANLVLINGDAKNRHVSVSDVSWNLTHTAKFLANVLMEVVPGIGRPEYPAKIKALRGIGVQFAALPPSKTSHCFTPSLQKVSHLLPFTSYSKRIIIYS